MFKIENTTFHVTRGDRGDIIISFDDYTFQPGDEVEINVYNEESMDSDPVLTKSVTIATESETATISLLAADTQLGNPITERVTYWYEIVLNGDQTPLCYDEQGAKLFYLYPGGIN